ncbi:LOW QUALITY PROTEIN: sialate O-acetylesterase-like [Cloeon dipterum]|uniref:LOW QUALITY PROTEIN: sialate O-acetylesterase-like n=1 Tax=Cloeon dipterum TaxID=197152 RepID=UPI00321F9037
MMRVAAALALFLALANGQSTFRLANYYKNGTVLQMEPKEAVIWGYGTPGASIQVFRTGYEINAFVESDGTWTVNLPQEPAGGPVTFDIIHDRTESVSFDAWFGDVWVCSGQSNMEMTISQIFNSTEETNNALSYQNIRLLQVERIYSTDTELDEAVYSIAWETPSASNVPYFSALCMLFGERLSQALGNSRPIGLIDSSWGGTDIEAWFSPRVPIYCLTPPNNGIDQNSESALWNGMIAPLTKTSVRGVIWYQGENNVNKNPDYYSCHITAMVQDWKKTFHQGNVSAENGVAFPFGIVQIGPTLPGLLGNYKWGFLRFHQTADQGVLPNAFLPESFFATAYDLTDRDAPTGQIHPRDKQTIADRLAKAARNLIYGENFHSNGPTPINSYFASPGIFVITFDRNIKIVGTDGFTFQKTDGTWSATSIVNASANSVDVAIEADAVLLTYAFRATVCEYKQCAIYSDDDEDLPAQVWKWDLTQ